MFSPEYEKRLLRQCSPQSHVARALFQVPSVPSATNSSTIIPNHQTQTSGMNPTTLLALKRASPRKGGFDRFIPQRAPEAWRRGALAASLAGSGAGRGNENQQPGTANGGNGGAKKIRDCDGSRDGLAYGCLLRNELLDADIDDVRMSYDGCDDRTTSSAAQNNANNIGAANGAGGPNGIGGAPCGPPLFRYRSPQKQVG
ncbi:fizzy-related protein homolog [Ctenocephalides felis]|uniref:fizzy-related protein homolog n=1 Tax=Ctenocephalides felis TaxID=7515 RepID=UPI000E6E2746|nr:fizzy-related protein homolog [Ctenocephalides felis]